MSQLRFITSKNRRGLWLPASLLCLFLTACGGGGGSGNSGDGVGPGAGASLELSTNSLRFTAASPALDPSEQGVTATFTGSVQGNLYILISYSGAAIQSVSGVTATGARTGSATVYPASAKSLGPGNYSGTITVTACVNDPSCATGRLAGSPQTINVSYEVKPSVQANSVAPRIAVAGRAGEVVIRGTGFMADAIQGVRFGATNAASFSVISDSEIHALYPALTAGAYPVVLQKMSGANQAAGTLASVNTPNYAANALAYPAAASGSRVRALAYDAERKALFVALAPDLEYASTMNGYRLLRYEFSNGAWQAPLEIDFPKIRDLALSPDGTHLLALSDTEMKRLDPVTLATVKVVTRPSASWDYFYFKNFALANDGFAVVTTGVYGTGFTDMYLYSTSTDLFHALSFGSSRSDFSTPGASGNGSLVMIADGMHYDAKAGAFSSNSFGACKQFSPHTAEVAPSLDLKGDRMIVSGMCSDRNVSKVLDASFNEMGTLVDYGVSFAANIQGAVMNPDGTRAYIYDAGMKKIRTFDLTAPPVAGMYQEIVPATALAGDPGSSFIRMAISPDGGTLFVAGSSSLFILPAP